MKIYPSILLMLQFLELLCYINLYIFIRNHNQTLATEKIISQDNFRSRSRVQSISLYAQFLGFVIEIIYNILHFLIKILGRKLFLPDIIDFSNYFKLTEFGLVTTIDILATPDLRNEMLLLIRKRQWAEKTIEFLVSKSKYYELFDWRRFLKKIPPMPSFALHLIIYN